MRPLAELSREQSGDQSRAQCQVWDDDRGLTVGTLQMDRYWPEMALIAAQPEHRRVIDIRSRDGDTEETRE